MCFLSPFAWICLDSKLPAWYLSNLLGHLNCKGKSLPIPEHCLVTEYLPGADTPPRATVNCSLSLCLKDTSLWHPHSQLFPLVQCSFHVNWCREHSAEKRESKENQQPSDCIIFLKNTNWPCQDNYCRLGDTDFLWQVRWKTYWFWGEYRKKKSLLCWMRSLRLFFKANISYSEILKLREYVCFKSGGKLYTLEDVFCLRTSKHYSPKIIFEANSIILSIYHYSFYIWAQWFNHSISIY